MPFITMLASRIESGVILGAVLVVAVFGISTNGLWLNNLPNILSLTAVVGIIAIGQALLMMAGEVDLSVGSVFAAVGVAFLMLLDAGIGVAPAMLLSMVFAATVGFANGVITVKFKVPSMIVTLGAMFVFRGLVYILTTGYSLSIPRPYRHDPIVEFLDGRTLGYSHAIGVLLVVMLLFVFILLRTRLGNHILCVGGEPNAALANGVSPDRVKTIAFIICSMLAGLAGLLATCQEGAIYSTSGKLIELDTIAAAVMGGCTLRGGIGSVWGPVLGVFILSSLKGGLMMMGAPTYWYISFVGAILILFLIASRFLNRTDGETERTTI